MIIQNKEEEFRKAIQAVYSWPHGKLDIQKMDLFASQLPIEIVINIIDEFLACFVKHLNGHTKKLKELEEDQERYSIQTDDVSNFDKTSWDDNASEFMEYKGYVLTKKNLNRDIAAKQHRIHKFNQAIQILKAKKVKYQQWFISDK